MRNTHPIQFGGKPYEAGVNFDGSKWQVVGWAGGKSRVVISEHDSHAEAVAALAALVK